MKLGTVISYCTNDESFIRDCIDAAIQVSDEVIVPISTHLYDGTPEDLESIKKLSEEYPNVNFTTFDWTPGYHPRYWHNMSRIIGNHLLKNNILRIIYQYIQMVTIALIDKITNVFNFTRINLYYKINFKAYHYYNVD